MSRLYDGDYEENFPGEGELWAANAHRALKGKRGRKVLADLREALQHLPQPRLIEGAMCTVGLDKRRLAEPGEERTSARFHDRELEENFERQGEGVCAVGALLWWNKVKSGVDPAEAFDQLPTLLDTETDLSETAEAARRELNVVYSLAWNLAYRNDETFGNATPEQRYLNFMAWLDAELGPSDGLAASRGVSR